MEGVELGQISLVPKRGSPPAAKRSRASSSDCGWPSTRKSSSRMISIFRSTPSAVAPEPSVGPLPRSRRRGREFRSNTPRRNAALSWPMSPTSRPSRRGRLKSRRRIARLHEFCGSNREAEPHERGRRASPRPVPLGGPKRRALFERLGVARLQLLAGGGQGLGVARLKLRRERQGPEAGGDQPDALRRSRRAAAEAQHSGQGR